MKLILLLILTFLLSRNGCIELNIYTVDYIIEKIYINCSNMHGYCKYLEVDNDSVLNMMSTETSILDCFELSEDGNHFSDKNICQNQEYFIEALEKKKISVIINKFQSKYPYLNNIENVINEENFDLFFNLIIYETGCLKNEILNNNGICVCKKNKICENYDYIERSDISTYIIGILLIILIGIQIAFFYSTSKIK